MKDDIETLRRLADGLGTEERKEAMAALDGLECELGEISLLADARCTEKEFIEGERDSLRKALDDRHAADLKAAKAIFAATGRKWGFPTDKEVVAFLIAEVERLDKDSDAHAAISLHSILEAIEALEPFATLADAEESRWGNAIPPDTMLVAALFRDCRSARDTLTKLREAHNVYA